MGCEFTFIHCADLHLGSRCWGSKHDDPALGKRFYESTFASFRRIVDLGLARADFMVISGDIYDELTETPRTRLFFASEMKRLSKPCFIVTGNHDARHSWSESIPYPPNVYQFGASPSKYRVNIRGTPVEVTGISFDGPHTDENLVAKLRGSPGVFTVGVVHCEVGTAGGYAPCSMEDFLGKDIQYWALGHIHKRMVLREAEPAVIYPGNIQGRDISESGEKGCMLVHVDGGNVSAEFVPTQEILWKEVAADITGKATLGELIASVRAEIPSDSIIGLDIVGRGPLNRPIRRDPAGLAERIEEETGCPTTVRKLTCTDDIDLEKLAQGETLASAVVKAGDSFYNMSEEELLDAICCTAPSKDVRMYLEYFAKHGRLHDLVREAQLSAVSRILEGSE